MQFNYKSNAKLKRNTSLSFLLLVCSFYFLSAQERISRAEYIERYSDIAVEEMKLHGIPASIKLAQALLESDNGNSKLARKANNHFGIKCHDWKGRGYYQDDDKKNECFRRYKEAEQSFRDHSAFLTGRKRYAFLFDLEVTDYKAWARGLKRAGYATNPRYPQLLIKIIEDNKLYRFDSRDIIVVENHPEDNSPRKETDFPDVTLTQKDRIQLNNDVKFVIAGSKDTYETIGDRLGVMPWLLRKFNEVEKDGQPGEGDMVYLQPKKRKGAQMEHECSGSESLWDISMKYAVKLKRLARMNKLDESSTLNQGQIVKLR